MLDRYMVVGLANPLIRLITYRGFSYAAAQAAIETLEPLISGFRDFLKEEYEALFNTVLRQHGLDPEKARIQLFFGEPEVPEYEISDIFRAVELGIISREEARDILRDTGWKLREEEEKENSLQLTLDNYYRHFIAYGNEVRPLHSREYIRLVRR